MSGFLWFLGGFLWTTFWAVLLAVLVCRRWAVVLRTKNEAYSQLQGAYDGALLILRERDGRRDLETAK